MMPDGYTVQDICRFHDRIAALEAEVERLRDGEWDYDSLCRILKDELPITMSLGLLLILVERMVLESVFAEPVEGLVKAVRYIAEKAVRGKP